MSKFSSKFLILFLHYTLIIKCAVNSFLLCNITKIYFWYTAFRFWHFKIQRKHSKKTNRCSKSCSNSRKWWRWWWRGSSILWRSFEYRSVTERHGTSRNVTERKRNWSCCGKVFVWKCQDFNGLKSNNFFIHVIIKLFSILVFYKYQFK